MRRRVFLYAFDLIELNGEDLRHEPIERRKAVLAKLLRHAKGEVCCSSRLQTANIFANELDGTRQNGLVQRRDQERILSPKTLTK
jgi:ATP-dependent DNA ligase